VTEAHTAGIRVILDYAMNHVHVSSPVYAQHNDWFWPVDYNGKKCVCGEGCSWEGPEGKRCWFRDYLPDFDFTNTDARNFSVGNAVQWIKDTGIDGFRLDAVKHIEDAWVTDLRAKVKAEIEPTSGEHFYMVGETFTGDRDTIKYYVDPYTMLDGQFDFPLRAKIVATMLIRSAPMSDLAGFLDSNDNYYGSGLMSTFVGNHDVPRSIHFAEDNPLWGNEWADGKDKSWSGQPGLPSSTSAFERLANAYTVIFTTRGIPLLYYGDEIGMPGGGDPDNRRMMQWTGLSGGQTKLLDHVKKLTALREAHDALRYGTRTTLGSSTDTIAYKMAYNADVVYVAINRGDSAQSIGNLPSGSLKDELSGTSVTGPSVSVPARSSMILVP
jgi:glycosidase